MSYNEEYLSYSNKLFFDIVICNILPKVLLEYKKTNKLVLFNSKAMLKIEFCYIDGNFVLRYDDFSYKLDNILAYQIFRDVLVKMLVNYGFEIVIDNNKKINLNDSLIQKGDVSEEIYIYGNLEQLMYMFECELYRNSEKISYKHR